LPLTFDMSGSSRGGELRSHDLPLTFDMSGSSRDRNDRTRQVVRPGRPRRHRWHIADAVSSAQTVTPRDRTTPRSSAQTVAPRGRRGRGGAPQPA